MSSSYGRMGQRIAYGAEQSDEQVGEAFLLTLVGPQGENGLLVRECPVHQVGAIAAQAALGIGEHAARGFKML